MPHPLTTNRNALQPIENKICVTAQQKWEPTLDTIFNYTAQIIISLTFRNPNLLQWIIRDSVLKKFL